MSHWAWHTLLLTLNTHRNTLTHTQKHTLSLINSWPSTQDWITAAAGAGFTSTISFVTDTPSHTHMHTHTITHFKISCVCSVSSHSTAHDKLSLFALPHFAFACIYNSLPPIIIRLKVSQKHLQSLFSHRFIPPSLFSPARLLWEKCQACRAILNHWYMR